MTTESKRHPSPFNSPLEIGVRLVVLLAEIYPESLDQQQLVYLDYLMIHSGDVDGPESLHPALPLRSGELLVKRDLVGRGLSLMQSRGLVERVVSENGIGYVADDDAGPFLDSLGAPYIQELKRCARWVVERYGLLSAEKIRPLIERFFKEWTVEFDLPRPDYEGGL